MVRAIQAVPTPVPAQEQGQEDPLEVDHQEVVQEAAQEAAWIPRAPVLAEAQAVHLDLPAVLQEVVHPAAEPQEAVLPAHPAVVLRAHPAVVLREHPVVVLLVAEHLVVVHPVAEHPAALVVVLPVVVLLVAEHPEVAALLAVALQAADQVAVQVDQAALLVAVQVDQAAALVAAFPEHQVQVQAAAGLVNLTTNLLPAIQVAAHQVLQDQVLQEALADQDHLQAELQVPVEAVHQLAVLAVADPVHPEQVLAAVHQEVPTGHLPGNHIADHQEVVVPEAELQEVQEPVVAVALQVLPVVAVQVALLEHPAVEVQVVHPEHPAVDLQVAVLPARDQVHQVLPAAEHPALMAAALQVAQELDYPVHPVVAHQALQVDLQEHQAAALVQTQMVLVHQEHLAHLLMVLQERLVQVQLAPEAPVQVLQVLQLMARQVVREQEHPAQVQEVQ